MVEASLTKARCGLQEVPKIKSNKFIVEKNFMLSKSKETIIPIVVKIATKEEVRTIILLKSIPHHLLLYYSF